MATPIELLVLDSDSGFLRVLCKRLHAAGWQHRVADTSMPLDAIVALRPNAILLDLAVVGSEGWRYVETLCTRLPYVGLVVCTGPSSMAERVRGLRLGADDWITKPCHPEELIARIEAVVRRRRPPRLRVNDAPLIAGEAEVSPDRFQVFVGGASADLTRREFELVHVLAKAEGRVLEREEIYDRVWGYAMARGDRSVDVFVHKLRLKLERLSPGWRYIHTQFGIGYRFAAEPVHGARAPLIPVAALRYDLSEGVKGGVGG